MFRVQSSLIDFPPLQHAALSPLFFSHGGAHCDPQLGGQSGLLAEQCPLAGGEERNGADGEAVGRRREGGEVFFGVATLPLPSPSPPLTATHHHPLCKEGHALADFSSHTFHHAIIGKERVHPKVSLSILILTSAVLLLHYSKTGLRKSS